ncbi:MAG TPA: ChaN family lipoprotein [Desulfuromonadaceae bacterium]
MIRRRSMTYVPYLALVLCLVSLTACCTTGEHVMMEDPQEPYPLASPPTVGQIVHLATGVPVSAAQMLAVAADSRIVYVGETHDNPASHRLELQLLQGLAERHPGGVALGMEMFVRSQQPVLDRWVAGLLDEKAFLRESRWYDTWRMDFAHYRDLLNFARERHIPVIALNAEKELVAALRSRTPDQLDPGQRAQLPELDLGDPYQRAMVQAIFGGHSHGEMGLEGFVRAQTLWDETMAESVARYLMSPAGTDKHMLVVAGGNHISYGFGIPRRVFRRLPTSYTLVGGHEIEIPPDKRDRLMDVTVPEFPMRPYDFMAYFAYEDLPKSGVTLGVMTEPGPGGRGIAVKEVVPGSIAERAGLRPGDLLLGLDNDPLAEYFDLIYALKRRHPGDKGTLRVERQGRDMKLDVLFRDEAKGHPTGTP